MKFATKLTFRAPTANWLPIVVVVETLSLLIILLQTTSLANQASAFHLSFGHRLRKYTKSKNTLLSIEVIMLLVLQSNHDMSLSSY